VRGTTVGDRWRWDDPERPSEGETRWGVMWNPELGEIFAVQILECSAGRVLLLGTITHDQDREGILAWLERMRDAMMARPNGLMILAWRIEALTA
jgi:hypothetical protein